MRNAMLRSALGLLFVLAPCVAGAYVGPASVLPANPNAGEEITIQIPVGGGCDALQAAQGYPQITRTDNAIRFVVLGVHEDDSAFCIYGTGVANYPLGALPAGSYTLQVDWQYQSYMPGLVTETISILPLAVAAVPATPIPATSPLGLLAMGLGMLALAAFGHRRFRRHMLPLMALGFLSAAEPTPAADSDRQVHAKILPFCHGRKSLLGWEGASFLAIGRSIVLGMLRKIIRSLVTLPAVLGCQLAQAYYTEPVLVPAHPVAGQPVSVEFDYGYCDVFGADTVTQQGNLVQAVIYSAHSFDSEACIYSPGHARYAIGAFAAGTYTVQVDRTYIGDIGLEQHPMASLSMIVAAAPGAEPIPSLGAVGMLALVLALLLTSRIVLRHRGIVWVLAIGGAGLSGGARGGWRQLPLRCNFQERISVTSGRSFLSVRYFSFFEASP